MRVEPTSGEDRGASAQGASKAAAGSRGRLAIRVILPLLVLAAGIAGATYIKNTAPKAPRKPPEAHAPLVQVMDVRPSREPVILPVMGTVIPAREIALEARVAGEVVFVAPNFVEGGRFREGDVILRLDATDYKLAVARRESAVVDARYQLRVEEGRQAVARREWEILNQGRPADPLDEELALRKPHLAKAKADLEAAEAELAQAKLDLERTVVRSPFNAVVRTRSVSIGSQVSAQEELARLVGTDLYWVQVSVPVDRLKWIDFPGKDRERGSAAKVSYSGGYEREAWVFRLLSDLDAEGRMARVLLVVHDPLDLEGGADRRPPLLIGEYVRAEVVGNELAEVVRIPRSALRDGDHVWLVGEDGLMEVRRVQTIWREADFVLVDGGLSEGGRLIVSDLASGVPGMAVRVEERRGDASGKARSEE
ncbi:Efflux transporter, RND family, MFP subunit [uncultured Desulfatiglans sp.]|nr:Efflux transporter, RND family, MFP subunit [uncultured Desulfatiglans sp.]